MVLQSDDAILSSAIWSEAYGGNGADPMGDLATIKATTPEQLEAIRKATFAAGNLLLVIEGPVTMKAASKLGTSYLSRLPIAKVDLGLVRARKPGPARVECEAFGEARGVPVPPLTDPVCVARLCAALAIASELKDAFVTYTPSALNGMVVVGQAGEVGKLGKFVDGLADGDADEMLDEHDSSERDGLLGKWVRRRLRPTPAVS